MSVCVACGFQGESDGVAHAYMSFSPACWARYGEIMAREFGVPGYFDAHRLLVDACCGQHSVGNDRRARQSLQIHLAGLTLHFEDGASKSEIVAFLSKAARNDQFEALPMPEENLSVSMAGIFDATDAVEHCAEVAKYARRVFDAWSVHRPVFRALISDTRI